MHYYLYQQQQKHKKPVRCALLVVSNAGATHLPVINVHKSLIASNMYKCIRAGRRVVIFQFIFHLGRWSGSSASIVCNFHSKQLPNFWHRSFLV